MRSPENIRLHPCNPRLTIKKPCGNSRMARTSSLRRHYPHQVQGVASHFTAKVLASQPRGSPALLYLYSTARIRRGEYKSRGNGDEGIHGVAVMTNAEQRRTKDIHREDASIASYAKTTASQGATRLQRRRDACRHRKSRRHSAIGNQPAAMNHQPLPSYLVAAACFILVWKIASHSPFSCFQTEPELYVPEASLPPKVPSIFTV